MKTKRSNKKTVVIICVCVCAAVCTCVAGVFVANKISKKKSLAKKSNKKDDFDIEYYDLI